MPYTLLDNMHAAAGADLVASLVVDLERRIPVVHVGTIGSDAERVYALGFPGAAAGDSSNVTWTPIGYLNLEALDIERVLLAGLSVIALKHVHEAGVQIGDPVLVLGADPWSLLLLQWAKLQGGSPLVFASRESRLAEYAASVGVDGTLIDPSARDVAQAVSSTYRGAGFAVALDAVATDQSIRQALPALRDGGRYVLAGLDPTRYIQLNAYPDLHRRDLEIVSLMHSRLEPGDVARMFRFSLDLAEQGRLRLSGLLDPALGWRAVLTRHA
jgi:threonine dehydrogenase-like Zn-dependent dehydrogenase